MRKYVLFYYFEIFSNCLKKCYISCVHAQQECFAFLSLSLTLSFWPFLYFFILYFHKFRKRFILKWEMIFYSAFNLNFSSMKFSRLILNIKEKNGKWENPRVWMNERWVSWMDFLFTSQTALQCWLSELLTKSNWNCHVSTLKGTKTDFIVKQIKLVKIPLPCVQIDI